MPMSHASMHAKLLESCPTLCNPMNYVACQASQTMEVSRQEYWSRLPCPPPGDLPDPGIEPKSPVSPALQADSLPLSHQGSKSTILQCKYPPQKRD